MKHEESNLQILCVKWFRMMYPHLLLFAIPNGGNRNVITASIMKREGTVKGVADLFLMHPKAKQTSGTIQLNSVLFHGLFIEMKTPSGKQSPEQKAFEQQCIEQNYKYVICRTFEEFETTIKQYLN